MAIDALKRAVETAKQMADEQPRDIRLAVYVLRDFPELKEWDLDDLAWSMYRGNAHRNDLDFLIEKIEAKMEEAEDAATETTPG
jgi:broad specificity phosphatase PhoE